MNIVILLLPLSLGLACLFVIGFIWSVKSGQYDDLETEKMRLFLDDEEPKEIL